MDFENVAAAAIIGFGFGVIFTKMISVNTPKKRPKKITPFEVLAISSSNDPEWLKEKMSEYVAKEQYDKAAYVRDILDAKFGIKPPND